MSFVGDALGNIVGGVTGAKQMGAAGERAAATQAGMAQAGISEQQRQFDKLVELMSPFVTAGYGALGQQQALAGLAGPEQQTTAISALEQSPQFQALTRQGEEAILQRASATGGLRGGNIQAALGQFRPSLLSQMIEQQYGRLGGLTSLGQASAAMQAGQGMQSATNIANLLAQQGQALAGGQLAKGGVARQTFGDILGLAGAAKGLGMF